jgi:C1A family cysteine protease
MVPLKVHPFVTTVVFIIALYLSFIPVSGISPDDTWKNTQEDAARNVDGNSGDSSLSLTQGDLRNRSNVSTLDDDIARQKHAPGLIHRTVNQSVQSATSSFVVPSGLPRSFDWRDHNGDWTTPVKDQGEECGSCWAYAAVGILESHLKITSHNPTFSPDLSEQYLISCDEDDDGCDGGDFVTAIPYIVDTSGPDGKIGTVNESVYPVDNSDDSCPDLGDATRYRAGRWAYVNASVEDDAEILVPPVDELKAAIYMKGPIAAGVDDDDAFDEYEGGIFSSSVPPPEETTNHAVVLVGWGSEDGTDYFIGKNSFGTEWGEDGWFRIEVNSSRIGEGAVYLDEE